MSLYRGPSIIGESADNTVALVLSAISSATNAANAAAAANTSEVNAQSSEEAAAASALQLALYEGLLGTDSATAEASRLAAEAAAVVATDKAAQTGEDRTAASDSAANALTSEQIAVAAQLDITNNWSDKLAEAAVQAGIATTGGSTATAQADVSTTQAGLAAAAKAGAEAARDASLIQAGVYVDEITGRAAVADGEAFKVQGSGDVAAVEYRRVNAGTAATLIANYPSVAAVASLRSKLLFPAQVIGQPTLPVTDGASGLDTSNYVFADPMVADGFVTSVAFFGGAVSGSVKVRSYQKSGDLFTVVSENTVAVTPGAKTVAVSIAVMAGQYLGFAASDINVLRYATGVAWGAGWYTGAGGYVGSSFSAAPASASLRLQFRFEVQTLTRISALENRVQAAEAGIAGSATKADVYTSVVNTLAIGASGVLSAGTGGLDNSIYALAQPAAKAGTITKFRCYATGAGNVRLMVFTKSGNVFTVLREQTVAVAAGYNSLDVSLLIDPGQFAGSQGNVVGYLNGASDAFGFYGGAGTSSFTDAIVEKAQRVLIGFDLSYSELVLKGSRPTAVDLPFENILVIAVGQSTMEGSTTNSFPGTSVTLAQEYDTLGFAAYDATPNALYPATVANTQRNHPTLGLRGEWPGLGCAASIRKALLRDNNLPYTAVKSTIIVANTASDGQRIGLLGPGKVPYTSGIAKAAALAGLVTGTSGVGAVIWSQGESDGPLFSNTDPAVYLAALKQIAASYDTDLRAATGQTKRVPLVCSQTTSTGRGIALAQLQASQESSLVYIAFPMYMLTFYDYLHPNPASSRIMGAYYGEVVKQIVMDGVAWEPLRIVSAQVLGNSITLTYNKSGLTLDTTLMPAQVNSGFSVKTGAGVAVGVSAVEVRNGNQVRLTCATAPAADCVVQYGNLAATGKAPYTGGAGNLRDSAGASRVFDGYPLHNWAVLNDWTL